MRKLYRCLDYVHHDKPCETCAEIDADQYVASKLDALRDAVIATIDATRSEIEEAFR